MLSTHGFFLTINSMILYFKHIIHIDDFPLNGHPPSVLLSKLLAGGGITQTITVVIVIMHNL